MDELTYPGYKDVPVSWLFLDHDLCVTPKVQQESIDMIEAASGQMIEVTKLKSGHCPIITQPDNVVDWTLDLVKASLSSVE